MTVYDNYKLFLEKRVQYSSLIIQSINTLKEQCVYEINNEHNYYHHMYKDLAAMAAITEKDNKFLFRYYICEANIALITLFRKYNKTKHRESKRSVKKLDWRVKRIYELENIIASNKLKLLLLGETHG